MKEDVQGKDRDTQETSTPWQDRQKWTFFTQLHQQQPDGDADG